MLKIMLWSLPALALCASSSRAQAVAPLQIVQNGQSAAEIIISPNASEAEKYAAKELQSALQKMSGAQLPISTQSGASTQIVIGTPQSVPAIEKAKLFNTKEAEETRVVRRGNTLFLAGKTPPVALRATYTFLQDTLGARWFWPGESGEYMPQKKTIALSTQLDVRQVPNLKYRTLSINTPHYDIPTMDWMARNRMNVSTMGNGWIDQNVLRQQNAERGFLREMGGHNAHLEKEVNEAHPEYVALVNGKRSQEPFPPHICWGNAGARAEMVKKMRKWWDEHPDVDIIGFFGPDHGNFCECELCAAYGPDVSTRWQKFSKEVIAQVNTTHPGKKYLTLAYQSYRDVPKGGDVAPVMFNGYCTYNIDYTKPITHPNSKGAVAEMLAWKKLGSNIGIRGYQFIPFNVSMYAPITDLIMQEVKWVDKEKLAGWTSEVQPAGHYWPKDDPATPEHEGNWMTNRMALYAVAQTMWNTRLSTQDVLRDWTTRIYGPAAAPMLAYHNAMEKAWQASPRPLSYFLQPPSAFVSSFFNDELVKNCDANFVAARAALSQEKDEATRNRIAKQIDFEHTLYKKWSDLHTLHKGRSGRLQAYAPRVLSKPQMTAEANDAAWKNVPVFPAFEAAQSAAPKEATRAFAQWDDEALYLRFIASDAEMNKLKTDVTRHDDPLIFGQDAIEMFLDDVATAGHYFHMSGAASGARYDAKADTAMNFDTKWNPDWTTKTSRNANNWIIDMKLPFASFGRTAKLGDEWRMSFFRSGDERLPASGWPNAAVHNSSSFGTLHLVEKAPQQKRAVLYDAGGSSEVLQTELAKIGFAARSIADDNALSAALSENPEAVVLRVAGDGFKLNESVLSGALRSYLGNGGLVFLSSYGGWEFEKWLGPEAKVKWDGWDIDPLRRTTFTAEGAWLSTPHDLKAQVMEGVTPSSGFTPVADGWEILAKQKMKDGNETAYVLRRKIGQGTLILTSTDFGYGGGHEMFGNGNPDKAAQLLDNLLAAHRAR